MRKVAAHGHGEAEGTEVGGDRVGGTIDEVLVAGSYHNSGGMEGRGFSDVDSFVKTIPHIFMEVSSYAA
jgi:hypothetical protein